MDLAGRSALQEVPSGLFAFVSSADSMNGFDGSKVDIETCYQLSFYTHVGHCTLSLF